MTIKKLGDFICVANGFERANTEISYYSRIRTGPRVCIVNPIPNRYIIWQGGGVSIMEQFDYGSCFSRTFPGCLNTTRESSGNRFFGTIAGSKAQRHDKGASSSLGGASISDLTRYSARNWACVCRGIGQLKSNKYFEF